MTETVAVSKLDCAGRLVTRYEGRVIRRDATSIVLEARWQRDRLMNELRDILTRVGQTAIYVTHDQQEAFALADRVVILNAGRVAQIGAPQEVYRRPADAFVARFLGLTNLISGQWSVQDPRQGLVDDQKKLRTALGELVVPEDVCSEGEVVALIRPDAAALTGAENLVQGTLIERSFRGGHTRIVVCVNEIHLEFEMDSTVSLPPIGSAIRLWLRPGAITCLPA